MPEAKTCQECGAPIDPTSHRRAYCTAACAYTHNRREAARREQEYRKSWRKGWVDPLPKKMMPCLKCGEPWLTDKCHRICPKCQPTKNEERAGRAGESRVKVVIPDFESVEALIERTEMP